MVQDKKQTKVKSQLKLELTPRKDTLSTIMRCATLPIRPNLSYFFNQVLSRWQKLYTL